MPTLTNTNPLGAVDIPLLGRVVEAGETFEVTVEQAKQLGAPSDNFAIEKTPAKKKDD